MHGSLRDPTVRGPARQRLDGAARVAFGPRGLTQLAQRAPCRYLFPQVTGDHPHQAIAITTSGGLTGGDRVRFRFEVEDDGVASGVTQAAEKLYRALSDDTDTQMETSVSVGARAWGEWLAQEAILFDGARVRRSLEADVDTTGRLLVVESLVFGRGAMGETVRTGRIHDQWRIRRAGRLIWADALRLEGDIAAAMAAPFGFGDARATGTLVYVGEDAASHLSLARSLMVPGLGGITCFDGMLIARLLSADAAALRGGIARLAAGLRAAAGGLPEAMPTVWNC